MIVIGLTGSIAMGKSTTADLFAEAGIPVIDSDAIVHDLYAGPAIEPLVAAFGDVAPDGVVDRSILAEKLRDDPEGFSKLEGIVHPLVRKMQDIRLAEAKAAGHPAVILDIPLLFEIGADDRVDTVVVVSAPTEVQRARALARPGMTPAKLDLILSRQMPDAEKRRRADHVIDTSKSVDDARRQVQDLLAKLGITPRLDAN